MKREFSKLNSLFPLIRKIEKIADEYQDRWPECLILLAAVITDQGLLAGQTRETFFSEHSYSQRTAKLFYISVSEGEKCHIECKEAALSPLHHKLWKESFPNSDHYKYFGDLLDLFWERCVKSKKTVSGTVHFPDIEVKAHGISLEMHDYEETFVTFTADEPKCLHDYLTVLARENHIEELDAEEWAFFIHYVLKRYYVRDSVLRSVEPGKHHKPVIAKCDEIRFSRQVENHLNLTLRMLIALTAQNAKKDNKPPKIPNLSMKLKSALLNHHNICCSCRTDDTDEDNIDFYCDGFARAVEERWDILHDKPYVIYKLWNSSVQNKVATANIKITPGNLSKHIRRALQDKVALTDEKIKKANSGLFCDLIRICFPNKYVCCELERLTILFDELENQDTTDDFFARLNTIVHKYIDSCLVFDTTYLMEYTDVLIKKPESLPVQANSRCDGTKWQKWKQWLEDTPHIIQELQDRHPTLSDELAGHIVLERWLSTKSDIIEKLKAELQNREGYKLLRSRFRNYFEKPSEDPKKPKNTVTRWEIVRDDVVKDILWDSFLSDIPELVVPSTAAVTAFRKFLIAWTVLQIEVDETRSRLKSIFRHIFASLYQAKLFTLF